MIKENKSRFDENVIYRRYQQLYKGLLVDGGGYTASYRIAIGPNEPNDPCKAAYRLSPYILSDINIDINSKVERSAIKNLFHVSTLTSEELLITHNLDGNCGYRLMWQVSYFDGTPKTSWVDAKTGDLVKTINSTMYKNAPTEDYGVQNLDDNDQGNYY